VSGPVLIVILLAAFALAIALIQAVGRMIDSGGWDGWADGPPDTGGTGAANKAGPDVTGPGRPK
jgi:hypothetical protein